MPTIQHNVLAGSELHEPKGVASAAVGDVYVANGAGSGTWEHSVAHFGGFIAFDSVTPAYQHSATTSDTVLNPTFTETSADEFTGLTSPNARIRYDGADSRDAALHFNASLKQSSGANRDVELVFYKNGVAQEGSRVIRTATTGSWGSVAMNFDMVLATNDYLEIFVKVDSGTPTIDFASAYLGVFAPLD